MKNLSGWLYCTELSLIIVVVYLSSDGFDAVQVQTYPVGMTRPPSSSDKYAVLAAVDTAATAINWSGQMNISSQSGEWNILRLNQSVSFLTA